MARVDEEAEDRHEGTIVVTQILECQTCGVEQGVDFDTGEYDAEMIDDTIETDHVCISCGAEGHFEYSGWTSHTDAG